MNQQEITAMQEQQDYHYEEMRCAECNKLLGYRIFQYGADGYEFFMCEKHSYFVPTAQEKLNNTYGAKT